MGTVITLPRGEPLTRDELAQVPDDGHRYELVDGTLIVTPAPTPRHQIAVVNLVIALSAGCRSDLRALTAPVDVALSEDTVLQPDLLVAARKALANETFRKLRCWPLRCYPPARGSWTSA